VSDRIEIVITPSPEQYRQLCSDLKTLHRRGADSNTAAVLEAVRSAAESACEAYDGKDKTMVRTRKCPGSA
jgi:hypothetical protein